MNRDSKMAMKKGTLLSVQNFETPRGNYRITHIRHDGDVFMFKTRDGELLECVNFNKAKGVPEP